MEISPGARPFLSARERNKKIKGFLEYINTLENLSFFLLIQFINSTTSNTNKNVLSYCPYCHCHSYQEDCLLFRWCLCCLFLSPRMQERCYLLHQEQVNSYSLNYSIYTYILYTYLYMTKTPKNFSLNKLRNTHTIHTFRKYLFIYNFAFF